MPPPGVPHQCGRRSDAGTGRAARGRRRRATSARTASRSTGSSHVAERAEPAQAARRTERRRSPATSTGARRARCDRSTRTCGPSSGRSFQRPRYASLPTNATARGATASMRASNSTRSKSPRRRSPEPGRRPVGGVRQPVAELRQRVLLLRVVEPRREAGVVQQPPEVVARVREVRRRGRRDASRVDPAEDAGETWGEDVGDGARSSCHAADSVARAASTSPCRPTSSAAARPGGGAWSSGGAGATSRSGRRASCGLHPALVEALLEQHAQVLAADRRPCRTGCGISRTWLTCSLLLRRRSTGRSTPPRTAT